MACDDCLRRTDLIGALAGRLDIEWRRRSAPSGVLALPDADLLALDPDGRIGRRYARFSPAAARAALRTAAVSAICRCAPDYPEPLTELPDPPAVLHVAGRIAALHAGQSVAIVGARRATTYGLDVARSLGRELAAAGVPVVSGMAMGIDSAAHVGALEHAPRPVPGPRAMDPAIAVLAGAVDVPYPPSRRRLYARILEQGCVVSEFPPGFGAYRWNFVARNRIIAGLAALTVVVEAAERSGSLTTADFAMQLGRPVAAVPGPVTSRQSAGTNGLIATGAAVARHARDVLELLLGPDAPVPVPAARTPVEPRLAPLLEAVERGHGTLAELAVDAASSQQVLQDLTELELRGLIRREFGGRYVRAVDGR